jgi:hypothetical protein
VLDNGVYFPNQCHGTMDEPVKISEQERILKISLPLYAYLDEFRAINT